MGGISPVSKGVTVASGVSLAGLASVDFSAIPTSAKVIFIQLDQMLVGSGNVMVQIGTGGVIQTSGYTSVSGGGGGTNAAGAQTNSAGFSLYTQGAREHYFGCTLTNMGGNMWGMGHGHGNINYPWGGGGAGWTTLSGALDTLRVANTAGAAFSTGTVSISYI